MAFSGLFLDVGSGGNPHPCADVLVDRYEEDVLGHRGGQALRADSRFLILADAERLPFRDKAFGYVSARHVLEHCEDAGSAADELSRVGSAGYVETPSELYEMLCDPPAHKWFVGREGDVLLLKRKSPRNHHPRQFGRLFEALSRECQEFFVLVQVHHALFTTRLEWKGRIAYRLVEDASTETFRFESLEWMVERIRRGATWHAAALHSRLLVKRLMGERAVEVARSLRDRVRARRRRAGISGRELAELLVCTKCRGQVARASAERWSCQECGIVYPARGNIIDMVVAG
jgi:Methyltransferase domain